ncbi:MULTISPECIES: WcbI family polysaccharide biosynthesis putative acetyltransferase [unclassified Sphingobium]|uniref:WcbI family polysaccharide biosynthesis putative acetyltransferase n=1 Tax=unclassified Sphingobium TaxID=2611147 RepID=UPI000D4E64DF|nr:MULTISPECIES: WcbI family polysaccharide biosynthesis putative acetyltransferase [unclassified Sphingobium]PSO09695.1 hypothetical protein C7E20_20940 [Sphingobium sp. AEW4]TWD19016.1 hypothetical protein FB596_1223 [Sphingobium sp. AEW013]
MTHRLAIIGSCQVSGMASTAWQLRPDLHIEPHHIGAHLSAGEIADRIVGFDTVITQVAEGDSRFPELVPSKIARTIGKLVHIPIFVFPGLHPDMIYIFRDSGTLPGPFSEMHSLIVVVSYLLGLSEERTRRLFNAYVFARLGYFTSYETSRQGMIAQFAEAGYDMQGMPEHWLGKSGAFMYTMNHPAIPVLAQMAVDALKRTGLIPQDATPPEDVDDYLSTAFVAPVFPSLARRIGLAENDRFLKPVSQGEPRDLSLEDYISHSFAMYRDLPAADLDSPQVRHAYDTLKALLY